jgi:hypothetical protein
MSALSDKVIAQLRGASATIYAEPLKAVTEDFVALIQAMNGGGPVSLPNGSVTAPALAFGNAVTVTAKPGLYLDTTSAAPTAAPAMAVEGNEISYWTAAGFHLFPPVTLVMGEAGIETAVGGINLQRTGAAASQIVVTGESGGAQLVVRRFSTDAIGPNILMGKSRGTNGGQLPPSSGDQLSNYVGQYWDGGGNRTSTQFICRVVAATPSATDAAGQFAFVTAAAGSVTLSEIARLDAQTGLSLFGSNPVIDANRLLRGRVFTVATLPTSVEGAHASISDATLTMITGLGLAPVGGSNNHVPVIADNVGWKIV